MRYSGGTMLTLSNAYFKIIIAHYAKCGKAERLQESFTASFKHQEQIWGDLVTSS